MWFCDSFIEGFLEILVELLLDKTVDLSETVGENAAGTPRHYKNSGSKTVQLWVISVVFWLVTVVIGVAAVLMFIGSHPIIGFLLGMVTLFFIVFYLATAMTYYQTKKKGKKK